MLGRDRRRPPASASGFDSPGRSTRTTSAPSSASIIPANGVGPMPPSSTTRMPASGRRVPPSPRDPADRDHAAGGHRGSTRPCRRPAGWPARRAPGRPWRPARRRRPWRRGCPRAGRRRAGRGSRRRSPCGRAPAAPGSPGPTIAAVCRSRVSEWAVVLPKSRVGSTSTRSAGMPAATARSGALAQGAQGVVEHPERLGRVGDADRVGARWQAAGVRDDVAGAGPGRDVHEVAVVTGPGVVDQVEAGLGRGHPGHLRAPGVEAEHEVGVVLAGPGEERHDPLDLLLGRHHLALLAGPHPADVDDVGAELDGRVERAAGRGEVAVPVARPERVVGAVDDRHHRRGGRRRRCARAAAARPGRPAPRGPRQGCRRRSPCAHRGAGVSSRRPGQDLLGEGASGTAPGRGRGRGRRGGRTRGRCRPAAPRRPPRGARPPPSAWRPARSDSSSAACSISAGPWIECFCSAVSDSGAQNRVFSRARSGSGSHDSLISIIRSISSRAPARPCPGPRRRPARAGRRRARAPCPRCR